MDSLLQNPILRKVVTGVTGIGLTLFVLMHMVGNLQFFSSDPNAFNRYTYALESFGPILYAVEIGLLVFVILHVIIGTSIALKRRQARPVGYSEYKTAGDPSLQSLSSKSMIVTGIVLAVFLFIHISALKYGPGVKEGYVVTIDGVQMRDLKRLLIEHFQSPIYTFSYIGVIVLLAMHLRHGVWSSLQSLGLMTPRLTPVIYTVGLVFGVLIAIGFIVLPLFIFFSGGAP